MAEWTKAGDLKSPVGLQPTGGSNPSPSAIDYFVFYRGNLEVVVSDDNMVILSLYKQWAEKWLKENTSAIIGIL